MAMSVQLQSINIPMLIAHAGGDPWAINQSLQAGRPAQIADLAEAFHAAAVCTAESSKAFADARDRFEAAWNRETGGHPINDSDEVQRVTKSLGAQSLQLPKIGVDLEKIAAALAEAQKAGAARIAALETQLQTLDKMITQALAMEQDTNLSEADRHALAAFITTCEDDAINDTKAALTDLLATRNGYEGTLKGAMASLHSEGYDLPASVGDWLEGPLPPGQVRNLGPIAGTGANPGIPGIGAADLGEVVQLQDGRYVAIFGDSFSGNGAYDGTHYPSVAVPVTFDEQGRPHFGEPLTGPDGSPTILFPPPPQAAGKNTLPAGSIRMRDGTTYVMATGTTNLNPDGGSWLTRVTNDPAGGWRPIDGSWRAPGAGPTQISGYQARDGNVYIAANSFDRGQNVDVYRVDPAHVTDRSAWQPWTGNGWGTPGQTAASVSQGQNFGELSFREVDGKPVLSGFNANTGNVEVRVANDPTQLFTRGAETTVVNHGATPQPYGGYILPGSTLDNLRLFVSQWNTAIPPVNVPYNVQEVIANVNRP
jgi:Domain of unknown function (DUF4185)